MSEPRKDIAHTTKDGLRALLIADELGYTAVVLAIDAATSVPADLCGVDDRIEQAMMEQIKIGRENGYTDNDFKHANWVYQARWHQLKLEEEQSYWLERCKAIEGYKEWLEGFSEVLSVAVKEKRDPETGKREAVFTAHLAEGEKGDAIYDSEYPYEDAEGRYQFLTTRRRFNLVTLTAESREAQRVSTPDA